MKVGLQTISWGAIIEDMEELASSAQILGYDGLEFAQTVSALGPAAELRRLLQTYDLRPIGLAGGSLQSRIEYAEELGPDYLYIDEWDEEWVMAAIEKGFSVGIHPHLYKAIDTISAAQYYLERIPKLGLILDTAHLYLSDDDILEGLNRYGDRILAVHLKDWTGRYGRSPFRFSRGFVALGEGEEVKMKETLKKVVDHLLETGYGGWVIVEQDTAHGDPIKCAEKSRKWLQEQGVTLREPK